MADELDSDYSLPDPSAHPSTEESGYFTRVPTNKPQQSAHTTYEPPPADIYVGLIGFTNSGKTTFVKNVHRSGETKPKWRITPVGEHVFKETIQPLNQTAQGTNPAEIRFFQFQCQRIGEDGFQAKGQAPKTSLCILDIAGAITIPGVSSLSSTNTLSVYTQFYKLCHALVIFFPYFKIKEDPTWRGMLAEYIGAIQSGLTTVQASPKLTIFCVSQMDHMAHIHWINQKDREKFINERILNNRLREAVQQYRSQWVAEWHLISSVGYADPDKIDPNIPAPNNSVSQTLVNEDAAPIGVRELIETVLDTFSQAKSPHVKWG